MQDSPTVREILRLHKKGLRNYEITKLIGCTKQNVSIALKARNIAPNNPPLKETNCEWCGKTITYKTGYIYRNTKSCFKCVKENRKKWHPKYDHCIDCKDTEYRHCSGGRCSRCYCNYRYQNNPRFRERLIERTKARYYKKKELRKKQMREYYKKNKEKLLEYGRAYHAKKKAKKA